MAKRRLPVWFFCLGTLLWLIPGLMAARLRAQTHGHTLFLADNSRPRGLVKSITAQSVQFVPDASAGEGQGSGGNSDGSSGASGAAGGVKAIPRDQVMLIFNQRGEYLALSPTTPPAAIQSFLNPTRESRKADVIIASNGNIVACRITNEDHDKVHYLARGGVAFKAPKRALAAMMRVDGTFETFGPIETLAPVLRTSAPLVAINLDAAGDLHDLKLLPLADASEEVDLELYSRKALSKVEDLGRYVKTIADKNTDIGKANETIDLAVGLFDREDRQVEVTQANSQTRTSFAIRPYLNRLKLLRYDNVRVGWANISYVSQLRKGPDGNYYGIVTFDQVFEALMEDRVVYRDITRKNIEIILKTYRKQTDGREEVLWDVFLSDIGVSQTRA